MNKHFEDAQYYLKRAGETAADGLKAELEPLADRARAVAGLEEPPEPSRIDRLRADLESIQERAEGETKEAIGKARKRLRSYRDSADSNA